MDLKDLKLNDLIKIALAVTITAALTFSLTISVNNTTIINNYQEINKKLDTQNVKLSNLEKVSNDTQSNITKVKADVNKSLIISQKILKQVD